MEYDDFCIRTVWIVLDFDTNACEIFRVPQRNNIMPQGVRSRIKVTGPNKYTVFEDFAAHALVSFKHDLANDVGGRGSALRRPTVLTGSEIDRR
jgi:hypothetical protein